MKRNIPFDRYGSDSSFYSPQTKNNYYMNNSGITSTKNSQVRYKDDLMGRSQDLGRSDIKNGDF